MDTVDAATRAKAYQAFLGSIGASARRMVIDPSAPAFLNNWTVHIYDSVWPEI